MKTVRIILRRELASYFATPLAYVVIVIFLLLANLFAFFFGALFERGQADLTPFFTFLPSFLFILAGGPLVEATHGDARIAAPLTGITAAVVGVIVSLAVFFGLHVFWPAGFAAARPLDGLDAFAVAIFAAGTAALFATRAGVIPLVLAGALAGLVRVLVA